MFEDAHYYLLGVVIYIAKAWNVAIIGFALKSLARRCPTRPESGVECGRCLSAECGEINHDVISALFLRHSQTRLGTLIKPSK
jgi:hypothetical protein